MNWGLAMTDHSNSHDNTASTEIDLDLFFAAARDAAPEPDAALFAAVLADAGDVQAQIAAARAPAAPLQEPRGARGLWAQLVAAIGGWPAVGGLASVATAGLWLGAVQPMGIGQTTSGYLSDAGLFVAAQDSYLVDVIPGLNFDFEEG